MSLLEEIEAASTRRYSACSIGAILQALDRDDRTDLEQALADPRITNAGIAKVLTNHQHFITGQSVGRHRRGDCRCQV